MRIAVDTTVVQVRDTSAALPSARRINLIGTLHLVLRPRGSGTREIICQTSTLEATLDVGMTNFDQLLCYFFKTVS